MNRRVPTQAIYRLNRSYFTFPLFNFYNENLKQDLLN